MKDNGGGGKTAKGKKKMLSRKISNMRIRKTHYLIVNKIITR